MKHSTRRLFKAAATAFALVVGTIAVAHAQDVVVVSSGGAWQDAQDKALWAPAAKALGITYAKDTSQSAADVKAQVDSGKVTWDIFQPGLSDALQMQAAGLLEKLDPDVYNKADYVPGTTTDYFVPNSTYATVIAWNKKTYGDNGPKSMADFFDTKKFPGKRALFSQPITMIEAAALALGTPRDKVYDFLSTDDGRKATIAKLKELSPSVAVWWESGAQAAQLMKDGEVDMILTWGGRVVSAIKDGADWAYTFNDGALQTDGYSIVKGAPHRDAAMKFLKEMSKAQYQADLVNAYPTAPGNMKAFVVGKFSPETMAGLATAPENVANEYVLDPNWWTQYQAWASEAYDQVRLGN